MYLRILTAVFFVLGIGNAQDINQGQVLSLEECIDIALENNSALKLKSYSKETAENNKLNSYSDYLPTVGFSLTSGSATSAPSRRQARPDEVSGFDPVTGEAVYGGVINIPKSKRKFNSMNREES